MFGSVGCWCALCTFCNVSWNKRVVHSVTIDSIRCSNSISRCSFWRLNCILFPLHRELNCFTSMLCCRRCCRRFFFFFHTISIFCSFIFIHIYFYSPEFLWNLILYISFRSIFYNIVNYTARALSSTCPSWMVCFHRKKIDINFSQTSTSSLVADRVACSGKIVCVRPFAPSSIHFTFFFSSFISFSSLVSCPVCLCASCPCMKALFHWFFSVSHSLASWLLPSPRLILRHLLYATCILIAARVCTTLHHSHAVNNLPKKNYYV